jgi:hypothetical protein
LPCGKSPAVDCKGSPLVSFLVTDGLQRDVLWRDVRRNKQREALKLSAGAWNPADHPELAEGGAAHVEQIRAEPDERFEDAIRHQKR